MIKGMSGILTAVFITAIFCVMLLPVLSNAGSLEPSAAPGPTMKSLDDIYSKVNAFVSRTRFQIVLANDVSVLDNNTGLVWERATDPAQRNWNDANTYCSNLILGGKDDWHLPTKDELLSLADTTRSNPALPFGHPFNYVHSSHYWSSTTYTDYPNYAWSVNFYNGYLSSSYEKFYGLYVRCVR